VKELEDQITREGRMIAAQNGLRELLRSQMAVLDAGLKAVLGPDHLTEYECEHGTPLGRPCFEGCHLNPTRLALGITGTIPADVE
jgi:hypothetical protein